MMGTHPTFWNGTYNVVRWDRNSNTWNAVPWTNSNRKDAACGEAENWLWRHVINVACVGCVV
jgi:hypothetical protein